MAVHDNPHWMIFSPTNKCKWYNSFTSLVAQLVKNLPAVWETWVQFLDWEDPLEEDMATQPIIHAWRTPMARGAWWAAVHAVAQSRTWLSS